MPKRPVDRQDRLRLRLDVNYVIVDAPVLVGSIERAPPCGEGETAVVARQVTEIRHVPSMAYPRRPPAVGTSATERQARTFGRRAASSKA